MAEGKLYHDHRHEGQAGRLDAPSATGFGRSSIWRETEGASEKNLFRPGRTARPAEWPPAHHRGAGADHFAPWLRMERNRWLVMGDDTPARVLRAVYGPLSTTSARTFSQVTNPPIDSLREYRVMSLKTRFGNSQERAGTTAIAQTERSWFSTAPSWLDTRNSRRWLRHFNAAHSLIDCTFPASRQAGRAAPGWNAFRHEVGEMRALGCGAHHPDRSGAG